nr:ketopantoate reductase C-terminal domain-containing protein [Synechococcus sp. CCY 0621]
MHDTWRKFVFLVRLSGTTTTICKTIVVIRGNPRTRTYLLDVLREVVAVGRVHGVDPAEHEAEEALQRTRRH